MAEKILVTGSAGFMGSQLVDQLINEGHEVWGLDNFSIGDPINISDEANPNFRMVDLRDAEAVDRLVGNVRPDRVIHMAAWAHEGLSQFCPIRITENNLNAFLNIAVPCIKYGVRRLVVASSMSVYGAQVPPFDESMETKPEDVYAVAKAAMEKNLQILGEVHGIEWTIIRPHNVYGPRQIMWDPYRNVVGIFMNRILQGKQPIIYGDGTQTRAFSYIDDVTPYIAKAAFLPETNGEIINVGPIEEYSINHLARTVLDVMDSDLEPLYYPDRPKEVKHAYCTNDKAQRLLGYKTSVTLEEGLTRMAEWARTHGPFTFRYLDDLELKGGSVPKTWSEKHM